MHKTGSVKRNENKSMEDKCVKEKSKIKCVDCNVETNNNKRFSEHVWRNMRGVKNKNVMNLILRRVTKVN